MSHEINLLKNNFDRTDSDLEKVQEFYNFLTGKEIPKSMSRERIPKMSENKAFAIIMYLQENLSIFPDSDPELRDGTIRSYLNSNK